VEFGLVDNFVLHVDSKLHVLLGTLQIGWCLSQENAAEVLETSAFSSQVVEIAEQLLCFVKVKERLRNITKSTCVVTHGKRLRPMVEL